MGLSDLDKLGLVLYGMTLGLIAVTCGPDAYRKWKEEEWQEAVRQVAKEPAPKTNWSRMFYMSEG